MNLAIPFRWTPSPRIPYATILSRLKKIKWCRGRSIGSEGGYPIFHFCHEPANNRGRIYLSAGIHGDEPATVEAALALLENPKSHLIKYAFDLFPCMNPWGYEHHLRLNHLGWDLNRMWRPPTPKPIRHFLDRIGRKQYLMGLCLHEDYDATGYYLYEVTRDPSPLGRQILNRIRSVIPIESRTRVDGRSCSGGLIQRNADLFKNRRRWPEAFHLFFNHTPRVFTLESPSIFPIQTRVKAHLSAVDAALHLLSLA